LALFARGDGRQELPRLISPIDDNVLVVDYWLVHYILLPVAFVDVTEGLHFLASHVAQKFNMLISLHELARQNLHLRF
jgi:hypothetical protein